MRHYECHGGPKDGERIAVHQGVTRLRIPMMAGRARAGVPQDSPPIFASMLVGIYQLEWVEIRYDLRRLLFVWKGCE